jgi:predicted DNA-binding transcriptional regulator YafY
MPPKESLDPPLLRQWKILRALSASRQGRTIRELQGDAQVSEKTVRRDLLTLAGAGFPLHERLADYGKKLWRIEARAGVPDFNITFDEALGLYLANRLLEPLAGSGFWESAQAAIQKIRVMLGDTAIRYVEKMADAVHVTRRAMTMPNKAEIVDTLLQGLEERKVVWLTYQSQRATEPVTYDVHPYGLTCHRGTLYLIGFAPQHNEIRHWKIARVEGAKLDVMPFQRPGEFKLEHHLADSFGVYKGQKPVMVAVRFTHEAARYVQETQWHGSQKIETLPDGGIVARFKLNSTIEIKSWILCFGINAEVLEPATLRSEFAQELGQMLRKYQEGQVDVLYVAKKAKQTAK